MKSRFLQLLKKKKKPAIPAIRVRVATGNENEKDFKFTSTFRIGRDEDCQVQLSDYDVSRNHAEVFHENDNWWVRDIHSSNGTFINGKKIKKAPIGKETQLKLGEDGPVLLLSTQGISQQRPKDEKKDDSVGYYMQHYFNDQSSDEPVGERTMFIRQAFKQVQQKQKWKYGKVIAVFACLFVIAGGYAIYKHKQVQKHKELAMELFYSMKSMELKIAKVEMKVKETNNAQALVEVRKSRARRKELEKNYQNFIEDLGIYSEDLSTEDRLIFRVASTFGECELNMPEGFVREVKNYIKKWQSTHRYARAIRRAEKNGYAIKIAEVMFNHDLPPEFFYLALQESDFKPNKCGPKTRWGIAKGIWQFIPGTARRYGLSPGPLYRYRRSDPRDERFNFEKATKAAARYLKDIYLTEAQASGLLVMASYNWGENRVRRLIKKMPENPRERNFWHLLKIYKNQIPKQTYDYVFYIVSAAVIGENPHLFGFQFDNPLAEVEESVNKVTTAKPNSF